jgi:hypothetical protein
METINFSDSFNHWEVNNMLAILLKEWNKHKVIDILNSNWQIEITFENSFEDIRETIIDWVDIGKSIINSKDYFINKENKKIVWNWFFSIIEVFKKDWEIIFQACDECIDWLYAFYNFETRKCISTRNDRKLYNYSLNN